MRFDPDSKFFQFCARLVELTVINLLWLLCALPIVTMGPATKAMLTCLYAWREGDSCGGKVFFRAFRADFGRCLGLWLGILFLGAMLAADYYIIANLTFPGRMAVIAAICFVGFALILFAGMVFPLLSQFPMGMKDTVINTVLLSLANLPKMLLVTAVNLLPAVLAILTPRLFVLTGFFWLLCGIALVGLYDIKVLERVFAPFREKENV